MSYFIRENHLFYIIIQCLGRFSVEITSFLSSHTEQMCQVLKHKLAFIHNIDRNISMINLHFVTEMCF